ncbi:MAG: hypothetical protein AAGD25_18615 [Cyanobacteria bacterium P01_F01_bin.150]
MKENIFNLFVFVDERRMIYELGLCTYEIEGTDEEKTEFLQERALKDFQKSIRFLLPKQFQDGSSIPTLRYDDFDSLLQSNLHMPVFEEIFQAFHAERGPLHCITPIVEGKPKIDGLIELSNESNHTPRSIKIQFSDYLHQYASNGQLDIPQLLNDDHLGAIKLLYENSHFVSSFKLLVSFIDTVSYLEFGDESRSFQNWLDKYVNLNTVGVTSDELWESRNSLLHMTTADSRKVQQGKVKRLFFFIGEKEQRFPNNFEDFKYFDLTLLFKAIESGIEKWLKSYNSDSSKIKEFVDRYDLIISDSRYKVIELIG